VREATKGFDFKAIFQSAYAQVKEKGISGLFQDPQKFFQELTENTVVDLASKNKNTAIDNPNKAQELTDGNHRD
jgi:hypothetical protein